MSTRAQLIKEVGDFRRENSTTADMLQWRAPEAAAKALGLSVRANQLLNWIVECMPLATARRYWRDLKKSAA